MRIPRWRQRRGKGIRPTAHRLVVHTRRLTGTLRKKPVVAIIVGEGKLAGQEVELRRKDPIGPAEMAVVNEHDRVQAYSRERRTFVLPERRGRIYAVVKGHAQRMVSRLDERFASVPVNTNGRLASSVLPGSR